MVWAGNDNNAPTERATGGGPPAAIYAGFVQNVPQYGLASEPAGAPLALMPEATEPVEPVEEVVVEPPEAEERDPIAAFLAGLGGD